MNALPRSNWFMTVEEYLDFEKQSDIRHEYVGGEVHAMAGASRRHGQIVMNIAGHLWIGIAARNSAKRTQMMSRFRQRQTIIYYPDVVVTCSSEEQDPLIIKHPVLVVEVLSPGTAATDRREKMIYYRNIPSLLCYLIVHQDERRLRSTGVTIPAIRGSTNCYWKHFAVKSRSQGSTCS